MKQKLILAVVCMIITSSAAVLKSEDEKYIGKTGEIDSGKKEIIVNLKSGTVLKMGDLLQVQTETGKIILEVTFPMQTVVKCKIKGSGKYPDLRKGMNVYKYSKDETADETAVESDRTYKIGDRGPAGGWIFYDKGSTSDGWRYLEAAPEDQESAEWGCYEKSIPGAKGIAIGTGKANTAAIIKSCKKAKTAARICKAYRGGGKNDWFLPSIDELDLMYKNLHKNNIGGFSNSQIWTPTHNCYWSSSEESAYLACNQDFDDGSPSGGYDKSIPFRVRAVRAF